MARKETIVNSAWTTDLLTLTPAAKLTFIWSWTNEHASLCGIYEIQRPVIEFETGVTGERMDEVLAELEAAERMHYDGAWLYVPARLGNINRGAPTVKKAVERDLGLVPEKHPYLEMLAARYPDYYRTLTVSIPSQKPDSKGKNETVSRPSFVQGQGHSQGSKRKNRVAPADVSLTPDERQAGWDQIREANRAKDAA